uniref:Uncharacterized protein n=1 Tax=Crocodylus porosus TaxID=8502 RepID=A0A7M4EVT3_CROPO
MRFLLAQQMASRCQKCGQQVLRYPPYTLVRITEGEMRSYYDFLGKCIGLECTAGKGTPRLGWRILPGSRATYGS